MRWSRQLPEQRGQDTQQCQRTKNEADDGLEDYQQKEGRVHEVHAHIAREAGEDPGNIAGAYYPVLCGSAEIRDAHVRYPSSSNREDELQLSCNPVLRLPTISGVFRGLIA
jgi:hypothetical protein